MSTQVIMPQLGESVVEGTVSKWLKEKGQAVKEYEPLLEINTDKVDSEIPSPASGVLLDILIPEGTTVQAGTVLAVIGAMDEAAGNGEPAPEPAAAVSSQIPGNGGLKPGIGGGQRAPTPELAGPPPGQSRDLGFISPVVAKIAGEHGIDLAQVEGTGQGGRITKKDVLAYIERMQVEGIQGVESKQVDKEVEAEASPLPPRTPGDVLIAAPQAMYSSPLPSTPSDVLIAAPPPPSPAVQQAGEVLPLSAVRRAIAEHMVFSKHTSPHVTTVMETDLSRVAAHREANKAAFARDGANLTYTAYFIAAIVGALKAYPIVNSSWSDEGILLHPEINIGMAASMGEAGLIVPVIKHADQLSLLGLSRAINDLASRARSRQLKPDEVRGGTFTLTNHGTSGSLFATPIINQPQCAILGVGAIQKRVVVVSGLAGQDAIAIRLMAYVSLTFDHRILDGAIADAFLGKVVELLQNWG
jgi:2-oxoglutarate dehydrogenase E2 component (dihydrolipoamide succinyltransferase)